MILDKGMILEPAEVSRFLWEFNSISTPAVIITEDIVYQARFSRVSKERVTLEVFTPMADDAFPVGSRCAVSFHLGERSGIFIVEVLELSVPTPPRPPEVVLRYPKVVARGETRRAFRYPVSPMLQLRVVLTDTEGQSHNPKAVDLSLAGILVEFPGPRIPELPVGGDVNLEIRLKNHLVRLTGEVRHQRRRQCGLLFKEVVEAGLLDPPQMLLTLLRAVEARWLEER
jgi:hypothetical protein